VSGGKLGGFRFHDLDGGALMGFVLRLGVHLRIIAEFTVVADLTVLGRSRGAGIGSIISIDEEPTAA
jgi:hypothetical protein